jgi:hypothetical protein
MISSFKEMGCRLFPDREPAHASRALVRWIKGDPYLLTLLEAEGFRLHHQRLLTAKQVRIIETYFY